MSNRSDFNYAAWRWNRGKRARQRELIRSMVLLAVVVLMFTAPIVYVWLTID